MKVGVMEGIRQMSVRMMDVPEIGDDEILAKVYSCNICTTDWQTWAGLRGSQGRKFPWAPGHEHAGVVVAVGSKVRPEITIGTHVVFSYTGCGECHFCRKGFPSRCTAHRSEPVKEGVSGSFGMAQYLASKASAVYKVSEDLPFEEAGFLEPCATAIHGVRRLRVVRGDDVLVIGAGNLGLVNAQVARAFGGRVLVSEIAEERCDVARSLGFQVINPAKEDLVTKVNEITAGKGVDAIILAVGSTKANEQALQVIAPMGRILFFSAGYPAPELHVDPNWIHYREVELIGTFGADPRDFQLSAQFLSDRTVRVDKMLSYKVPIDEIQRAFELAATPGNYRVSLVMW